MVDLYAELASCSGVPPSDVALCGVFKLVIMSDVVCKRHSPRLKANFFSQYQENLVLLRFRRNHEFSQISEKLASRVTPGAVRIGGFKV